MKNNPAAVYEKLRQHLDVMPIEFPSTESGIELKILKRFFTPLEAEVALYLSMMPETIERIHRRIGSNRMTIDTLEAVLQSLIDKKVINSSLQTRRGVSRRVYGKLPFAIGLYEFQVDRLTRGFEDEAQTYMDEAFMHSFMSENPRQMRTIPINETILPDRNISRYDDIRNIIASSPGPFVLQNCICRQGRELMGEQCRQTELKETCLALGSAARGILEENRGTELTRDETLAYLKQAEAEGLVLQAQNTRNPVFICCCCSCCCAILSRVKKLPNPGEILRSHIIARIDPEICISCGTCLKRCPVNAIDADFAVAPKRCIGCGLCVNSCPVGAISLTTRRPAKNPPRNAMFMYANMFIGRFGWFRGTVLLVKALMGFKV